MKTHAFIKILKSKMHDYVCFLNEKFLISAEINGAKAICMNVELFCDTDHKFKHVFTFDIFIPLVDLDITVSNLLLLIMFYIQLIAY